MPETDYRRMVEEATQAAAAAFRGRSRVPPIRRSLTSEPGRDVPAMRMLGEAIDPRSPSGVAGYASMLPIPPWAKAAAWGVGMAMDPTEAAAKFKSLFGLGQFPTTTPRAIQRATRETGGYSVNVPTGDIPTTGLMVSVLRNPPPGARPRSGEATVVEAGPLKEQQVIEFAERNRVSLDNAAKYFGTWRDPETGKIYLDVSRRFEPGQLRQATKFGEKREQISGYDVGAGKSFPIGNWEEFVRSPEFVDRLLGMERVGKDYLSQFPTRQWWSNEPFTDVYGEANVPRFAGLTAATAPNSAPYPNIQAMSEYMRRAIRGEPVLQPEFRIPETAMGGMAGPGGQMPMEASRANNLLIASGARTPQDLQRLSEASGLLKVREEGMALTGDPRAVPLDRHQVRLTEAPERGIYATGEEGRIYPKGYLVTKDVISGVADERGLDPRDFSADVWTGIRDTIQRTGQLYGTKFRGEAIPGESKSYADHFNQAIDNKAAHLRMSGKELRKRLGGGDAELLAAVLSTPAITAVLSEAGVERPF
jgi:hypothetical protein